MHKDTHTHTLRSSTRQAGWGSHDVPTGRVERVVPFCPYVTVTALGGGVFFNESSLRVHLLSLDNCSISTVQSGGPVKDQGMFITERRFGR